MDEEREHGRFEGMVIQKLDDLSQKLDEVRKDFTGHRKEVYKRINRNSQDIARQKGWMTAIGTVTGFIGGFVKSFIFKQ